MSAEFSRITLYLLRWVNFLVEAIYFGYIKPRQTRFHLCDMWSKRFYFSAVLLYLAPHYTWGGVGNTLAPRIRDSYRVVMETCPRSLNHLSLGARFIIIRCPLTPWHVCVHKHTHRHRHTCAHTHTHTRAPQKSMWNDLPKGLPRGGRGGHLFLSSHSKLVKSCHPGDNLLTHPDIMPGSCR